MANDTTPPGDGDPPEPDPTLPFRARLALDGVVGRSPALARTFEEMAEAATTNVPVHFVGGRGTGKTSLARALAAAGRRPFVEVNVADVPPFAVEAELFGTRREGFGSAPSVPGAMKSAEGGTLFLDEVEALEAGVQVKLLRALTLEEYRRVGSFMPERASFRLLTATSADLEAAARAGTFHPELYQQLSRRIIRVPSLGERRSDVPALVEALLDRAAADSQLPRLPSRPSMLAYVEAREWPGNLGELASALGRALQAARAEGATHLEGFHLGLTEMHHGVPRANAGARNDAYREVVLDALRNAGWNVAAAARQLGVKRAQLYRLIAQYRLERGD